MLNKAIKEIMSENGAQASVLCVAMGQSESTFSRMFMKDDSDPKKSSLELLARRLNIKVSDIYLKKESLEPEMCRFFYSAEQEAAVECTKSYVYIGGEWHHFTEKKRSLESSDFKDVVYLGEAPRWHTKTSGRVHCPELHKKLCK